MNEEERKMNELFMKNKKRIFLGCAFGNKILENLKFSENKNKPKRNSKQS